MAHHLRQIRISIRLFMDVLRQARIFGTINLWLKNHHIYAAAGKNVSLCGTKRTEENIMMMHLIPSKYEKIGLWNYARSLSMRLMNLLRAVQNIIRIRRHPSAFYINANFLWSRFLEFNFALTTITVTNSDFAIEAVWFAESASSFAGLCPSCRHMEMCADLFSSCNADSLSC